MKTSSTSKPIKYLVISDIHLCRGTKNPTSNIIKNLRAYFDNYKDTSKFIDLDIIFIAGDLFDTLTDLSGTDVHDIQIWASDLMYFCARHKIKLRLLRGTPSHDWEQGAILETVATLIEATVDFKYVNSLSIENIEDLGLNVLYVPDEWTANTDITLQQVKSLLNEKGLIEVDIAIMHGSFEYQMKDIPGKHQVHSEAEYLSIVKYYINVGHIHNFSVCDRIIAQGSFDRLAHGEEGPKGGTLITLDKDNGNSFVFIENTQAKGFITITLRYKDLDKSYKQIDKAVANLKLDDHVRIKANKDHPLYLAFDDLKVQYPMLNFTKTVLTEIDEVKPIAAVDINKTYETISITKENVIDLLMTEINSKYQLSSKQNILMLDLLEGAI